MQEEDDLTSIERELEAALCGIQPAATSLNRDELMYQAGARAARRSVRIWQSLAAVLAVGIGLSSFYRTAPSTLRIVRGPDSPVIEQPALARADIPAAQFTAAAMRDAVLAHGLDALPSVPPAPTSKDLPDPTPSLRPSFNLNPLIGDRS